MNPQYFNEQDWIFETQSGYAGARNTQTHEWIYSHEYFNRIAIKKSCNEWHDIMLEYSLETTNESLFDFLLRTYHSPIKINK